MMKKLLFPVLSTLCAAAFIIALSLVIRHNSYKREMVESAKDEVIAITHKAAEDINAVLQGVMTAADSIADDLTAGKLSNKEMIERMKRTTERNNYIYGVAVAYEPYAYTAARRLYAPYYVKKKGLLQLVQVESFYDYTTPGHEWYSRALHEGPMWLEPFFGEAGDMLETVYSVPFFGTDGTPTKRTPRGIVTISVTMDEIKKIVQNLDLGRSGFGALTSKKGVYLHHPNDEYVRTRKTIFDVAGEYGDEDRITMGNSAASGKGGIIDHVSTTTGLSSWLAFEPIPAAGWSLQNTFIKDDIEVDVDALRRQLVRITIAAVIFVLALMSLVLKIHNGGVRELWIGVIVTALLLQAGIGYIWYLSLAYDSQSEEGVVVADKMTLTNLMHSYTLKSVGRHSEPPVYVPTGFFIESVSLKGLNNATVTGYVWQKYYDGTHDGLPRGFVISRAEDVKITENYTRRENGVEVIRWFFQGSVHQNMDFARYPLEQENLDIRLLHEGLNHNVILVPDLAAYNVLSPSARPGLDKNLRIAGWHVMKSFFELKENKADADFGVERPISKEDFPALSFNITIRRNFIDSFISNLTPLLVVGFLLFTVLLLATTNEELSKTLGVGPGKTLSFCAALFFVVVFSHIDIRQKISSDEIFYIEYFYFVMYAALLWVSVNSILLPMAKKITWIQYKDNLISKLLYWPVIFSSLFALTMITFY